MNPLLLWILDKLHRKKQRRDESGFTLMEVMIVAAILVLLASVAVPQLFRTFEAARRQRYEIDAQSILTTLDRAVLNERVRSSVTSDIYLSLTPTVLSDTYGLRLTGFEAVDSINYTYVVANGSSRVELSYSGAVYCTDNGWDDR